MVSFRISRRALFFAVIGLSGLDLVLGPWAVHWKWFSTTDFAEFSGIVIDFVSLWTGRLVWVAGAAWGLASVLRKGQPATPTAPEDKYALIRAVVSAVFLRSRALPIFLVVVQSGIAVWAAFVLFEVQPYIPPSSQMLVTPYVHPLWPPFTPKSNPKKLYVANDGAAKVEVFDWDRVDWPGEDFRYGNQRSPIKPSFVAFAPRRELLLISVRDQDKLLIVDVRPGHKEKVIAVGSAPGSIAITPDERKAYVSNQLPPRNGTISVVDLVTNKVIKAIPGVNCPMGIALTPDGGLLYVASQCGGGEDPVFVIDTRSDKVSTSSIPQMAVGDSVLVARDGKKVYVRRSSYLVNDIPSKSSVRIPDQLSVIETKSNKAIKTIQCPAGITAMATTTDGKFLLLGSKQRLIFFDADTIEVITTIPLDATPNSIATSEDGAAFVWLPDSKRKIFVQGLDGIQKKMAGANLLGCQDS